MSHLSGDELSDSQTDLGPTVPDATIPNEQCETEAVLTFEQIVRLYQSDVRLYVARFVGNDPTADDIAQEVFVEVYRNLDSFANRGSLRAWIMAIARHRVGTWFRQRSRQPSFQALDIESDLVQYRMIQWQGEGRHGDNPADAADLSISDVPDAWRDNLVSLRSCMEKLKSPQRLLIQRFYYDGATSEAIGIEQGRSAATIRMALFRIRQALAKCIRKHSAWTSSDE
jgi:RNA polymerase sigma-70 factor (ECF subfamily)